jgi:hypothetical protein
MTDNIIKLTNNAVAHEIMERCGSVHLHFGYDDDRETIELEGSLTMSEVCFLKERLSSWIHDKLKEMEENV